MAANTNVNRWVEDVVKVLLRKDDLTIVCHQASGDIQISVKGEDGKFHTAELSAEEFARLYKGRS
jgi:hypothetical protein